MGVVQRCENPRKDTRSPSVMDDDRIKRWWSEKACKFIIIRKTLESFNYTNGRDVDFPKCRYKQKHRADYAEAFIPIIGFRVRLSFMTWMSVMKN